MRAPAHERIGLARVPQVGNRLVAAEVERADRHAVAGAGLDDLAIGRELLLLVGHVGVREEQVLRAEQAHAGRAHRRGGAGIGRRC